MASKATMDAVESQLAANWTNTPIIATNMTGTPPADGSAFLIVEYPIANAEQKSIGSPGANVFREEGAFRFVLSAPIGAGRDPFVGWMDALATAFRGATFSGVKTWAPTSVSMTDQSDRGAYIELSFSVPYYTDILG